MVLPAVIGVIGVALIVWGALRTNRNRLTFCISLAGIALLGLDYLLILGWLPSL